MGLKICILEEIYNDIVREILFHDLPLKFTDSSYVRCSNKQCQTLHRCDWKDYVGNAGEKLTLCSISCGGVSCYYLFDSLFCSESF